MHTNLLVLLEEQIMLWVYSDIKAWRDSGKLRGYIQEHLKQYFYFEKYCHLLPMSLKIHLINPTILIFPGT